MHATARTLIGLTLTAGIACSPAWAKTVKVEFTAMETEVGVDNKGTTYKAWTFNGQFPGPVVRATEGDTIEFSLTNPKTNTYPHAIDFHAGEMDALQNYKQVERGETRHINLHPQETGDFLLPLRRPADDPACGARHDRRHHH